MNNNTIAKEIVSKRPELLSSSIKFTHNRNDAEDLVQETMLKAYRNLNKFKDGTNLSAWLYTIMRNTFINQQKKNKKFIATSTQLEDDNDYANTIFDINLTVDDTDNNIKYEHLIQHLNNISIKNRSAFILYYHGYKYEDIANIMNISINTVKSKIRKCRLKLITNLQETYPNRSINIKNN